jgi:hypothetical protein
MSKHLYTVKIIKETIQFQAVKSQLISKKVHSWQTTTDSMFG